MKHRGHGSLAIALVTSIIAALLVSIWKGLMNIDDD